jgi:hypothetical protein
MVMLVGGLLNADHPPSFSISVSGPGIPRNNWSIFLILSSQRRKQDMGMGLSVARAGVQAHEGAPEGKISWKVARYSGSRCCWRLHEKL